MSPPANTLSDYTLNLPDDCLSSILQTLDNYNDRINSSLVCHRWLKIESHTRRRLKLNAHLHVHPSTFARFNSISDLSLIGRHIPADLLNTTALIESSQHFNNLTRLTLSNCRLSDCAAEALPKICAGLEEIHLEEVGIGMTIASLRDSYSFPDSSSLKVIGLKKNCGFSVHFLGRLIKASKSLRVFKLHTFRSSSDLGIMLQSLSDTVTEIRLEQVAIDDSELGIISSRFPNLETLCLVHFFGDCSDAGIAMVANKCRSLRKLHIYDFWPRDLPMDLFVQYNKGIRDEGLMAVANNCPNLEELLLDSVGVTKLSLRMIFSKCVKLETLILCGINEVRDDELMCIASECNALKKLWIEFCPVSDNGIQALANGCRNLGQLMFRECLKVTFTGSQLLRATRPSLNVDFE